MTNQGLSLDEAKRKLASIQEIKSVSPIPNADAIEVASIQGWNVVVRKGEFNPGDKVVYFEIDSFLPVSEKYAFVGKERINPITLNTANEVKGHRLATVVLRGQVSQGLALKFDEVDYSPTGLSKEELVYELSKLSVGTDVTKLLGVSKFDRPEISHELGNIVGMFPSHLVSKTDEERIQNEPVSYKKIKGGSYYISSKIEGTSITTIWRDSELTCATRNNVLDKNNQIEKLLNSKNVMENLKNHDGNIVFQSELYGNGVQKNPLGIQDKRLATFTIIKDDKILGLESMLDIVDELGLEIPAIVELGSDDELELERILTKIEAINSKREDINPTKSTDGPLKIEVQKVVTENFNYSIAETIERMNGTIYTTSGKLQEGGVIRPIADVNGREPVSFKVVNNEYLVKSK